MKWKVQRLGRDFMIADEKICKQSVLINRWSILSCLETQIKEEVITDELFLVIFWK